MKASLLIASAAVLLASCSSEKTLEAPEPPAFVQKTPDNWLVYQQQKDQQKTQYIQKHKAAYDWFTDFAFSETDGVPYLLLRLLPEIAPEYWGDQENFLSVVGLFNDERQAGYPMPRGIGISAFAREDALGNIDYTSFTCAACHVGRVKTEQGGTVYLDGGINAEFNIVGYRVRVYKTLAKVIGNETDQDKKNALWVKAFTEALNKAQASSPVFFYKNYRNDWKHLDANYEAGQIALFKEKAEDYITTFANRAVAEYTGFAALLDKNYDGFQARALEGFPGMADATGISTVNGYIDLKKGNFISRWLAYHVLPTAPGITDFMSVWEQDKRTAEWDKSHSQLINGGGQWNGNIPIPMYRNMAAQLTLGLDNTDIRVSAFAVELLDGLPASIYPFDVDVELAKKGEALFTEHCAQCHQPHNGKVYTDLGVNLDRSYVVNWIIRKGGIDGFYKNCSPETTLNMGGKNIQPCAEFDGVSLEGKKDVIMSPTKTHHGYNARPLSGIWAQAPYLHTGSVPTMYHLLVPSERPDTFIKSRLEYDQKHLGFAWQKAPTPATNGVTQGYVFDTTSFATFTKKGHDTDIEENGKVYKLDWSDDKEGAWALIEYLKTL